MNGGKVDKLLYSHFHSLTIMYLHQVSKELTLSKCIQGKLCKQKLIQVVFLQHASTDVGATDSNGIDL